MAANGFDDDQTRSITALVVGTKVTHYQIISKIGAGGMGEVYLAEDTQLDRKVALKFLSTHLCQDEAARARFTREAKAAAKLDHPNIVPVFEVGEFQGRPFFVMAHIEGTSLSDVIKRDTLTIDQAIEFARQICDGLHKAHDSGVVHRDIKPANIIIDSDNKARILDFGLAIVAGEDALTKTGSTLGTVGYMSPEQIEGRKTDARSDLFSLGVVLYELIANRSPFRRDDETATLKAILHDAPEPMARYKSGVSDALQRIVSKLLEKDPDLRYQSAAGVIPDLKRLAVPGSQDLEKTSSTPKQKLRKAILPTSAVVLIVMLVLIVKPWRFEITSDNPALAAPRRLAVLYLKNRGSADDEYLSYGITEDLIVDLTCIGTMGVAPMPSILKYKDSDEELEEIAKHLHVGLVLNGSIHKSGDLIRVSAQLIDVEKELNLWANRWEETFENLPHIKEALAQGISQALQIDPAVLQAAQVGTPDAENPVAYDHYLRGKYTFENKSDESDVEVALGLYRKALELEPTLLAARRGVAAVLRFRGQYDQANEELKTTLAEARRRNLRSDEFKALLALAHSHARQSHLDEAQEYAGKALAISKELNDLAGEMRALTRIIAVYRSRGMYDEAVVLFDRILEINRHLNDQYAVSNSLINIGITYMLKGDYAKAMENYEQALEMATRLDDQSMIGTAMQNIGVIYHQQGDYEKALRNYEQALGIFARLGGRAGMADMMCNIGMIHSNKGNYEQALQNYEQALEIMTQIGDRKGMGHAMNSIGTTYAGLGDYEKALQSYEQALKLRTQIGDRKGIATAMTNIGIIYVDQGDYEKALQNLEQALEIMTQIGNRSWMVVAKTNIGVIYGNQGDYEKALQDLKQALDIATEIGERDGMEDAMGEIANVYGEQGDYRKSLEYARKSAEIRLELDTPIDSVWASYTTAAVLAHLGECDEAISTLSKVVTDAAQLGNAELISGAHQSLGMAYFYKGEFDPAKENYYAALKTYEDMGNRSSMDGANSCLGELYYFLNAPDSSRKYFEQALAIADELGKKATQVRASAYLAALAANGGDFDGGVMQLRAILEEAKDHANIENKVVVKRLLGQVLTENGQSEADRQEGRGILQEALSLATEQGYAHKIRWINNLLKKVPSI